VGATPELFGRWTAGAVATSCRRFRGEERLLFVNAWNEWGEGNHIEPDLRNGRRFLEALRDVLRA